MQQTLMLAFFILFPVAFLSGTVVPIGNMPRGIDVLWPQALALTLYGLVLLSISTLRFRRSLA